MSTTREMFYRDQKFSSYDELQKTIDDYPRRSYECLSIQLSRTLESAVRQKKISADRVVLFVKVLRDQIFLFARRKT